MTGRRPRIGVVFEGALHLSPLLGRGYPDLSVEAPVRSMGAIVILVGICEVVVFPRGRIAGGVPAMLGWLNCQAVRHFAPIKDPNNGNTLAAHLVDIVLDVQAHQPHNLDRVVETVDELWDLAEKLKDAEDRRVMADTVGAVRWGSNGGAEAGDRTIQTPNAISLPGPGAARAPTPVQRN